MQQVHSWIYVFVNTFAQELDMYSQLVEGSILAFNTTYRTYVYPDYYGITANDDDAARHTLPIYYYFVNSCCCWPFKETETTTDPLLRNRTKKRTTELVTRPTTVQNAQFSLLISPFWAEFQVHKKTKFQKVSLKLLVGQLASQLASQAFQRN